MTTLPQGKGAFLWQPDLVERGNATAAVARAQAAGFGHVIFKVANDTRAYPTTPEKRAILIAMVAMFKLAGVQVWGYAYVYGNGPVGEAAIVIQQVHELGLIGLYIDAEGEYKAPGKAAAATTYMQRLRAAFPDLPIALCSYRYPSYHRELPWEEFREKCTFDAPQVYWVGSHDPVAQLERSYAEYQAMTPRLPYVPVGSAYTAGTWSPTEADWTVFLDCCRLLGFSGVNFWEWAKTRQYLPAVWDAIAAYPWPVDIPPPPPPPLPEHTEIIASLMTIVSLLDAAHDKLDSLSAGQAEILAKIGNQPEPPTPPPANLGIYQVVPEEKANGHWQTGVNANGKPILGLPPIGTRLQWGPGERVQVILPDADVDGSLKFWVVYGKSYAGNAYNNPKVYVKEGDGTIVG